VPTQSTFGAGMNMAFKRSFLMEIGGFDPALGIGSITHSGEDLAAYFEGLSRGHQIAYEPGAIVYHTNRESYSDLRDKIFGRSVGFTAHLTRACMGKPTMCLSLLFGLPYILSVIFGSSPTNRNSKYPLAFRLLEIIGVVYGPLAYLRSRRNSQNTIVSGN